VTFGLHINLQKHNTSTTAYYQKFLTKLVMSTISK